MSEYSLHGFCESGNAYKAALMLQLCNADWKPLFVDFMKGATREAEYRNLNVMGEVPVLVHHTKDGDVTLSQSGTILTYLARRFGKFGGENEMQDLEILRWILFDNHKLTANAAGWRFRRTVLQKPDDELTKFMEERARSAFTILNTHLEGCDWVANNRPSIADISLCGYLFWPEHMGLSWDEYPNIKKWLANIQKLESWAPSEDLLPSAVGGSK